MTTTKTFEPTQGLVRWQAACLAKEWTTAIGWARALCDWMHGGGAQPNWPHGSRAALAQFCTSRGIYVGTWATKGGK